MDSSSRDSLAGVSKPCRLKPDRAAGRPPGPFRRPALLACAVAGALLVQWPRVLRLVAGATGTL